MSSETTHTLIFPWRQENDFRLLTDANEFYPLMLEAIRQAKHYILLEIYLFESGHVSSEFIKALQEAAGRGVKVFTIIDDLGSSNFTMEDRDRLQGHNMKLAIYNPLRAFKIFANVYRDHRKQLTVDGQVTITGGMGISDEFDHRFRNKNWREAGILIKGPVISDWQEIFCQTWLYSYKQKLDIELKHADKAGEIRGRLCTSRGGQQIAIKGSVIKKIRQAKQRVWITTAYFMPSQKLRRALREADQRGVDVRILVPGTLTDHPSIRYAGRRYYGPLLRDGVQIYEYQPRFIHAKSVICDDWISIGSANLDRWSFRWTLEANQEIHDVNLAQQAAQQFQLDLQHSEEIDYQQWCQRSFYLKTLEMIWGSLDALVERLHKWLQLERLNPWHHRNKK